MARLRAFVEFFLLVVCGREQLLCSDLVSGGRNGWVIALLKFRTGDIRGLQSTNLSFR